MTTRNSILFFLKMQTSSGGLVGITPEAPDRSMPYFRNDAADMDRSRLHVKTFRQVTLSLSRARRSLKKLSEASTMAKVVGKGGSVSAGG